MYVYTEEEIHAADTRAAENGLSGNALMETAGRSLFQSIRPLLKKDERILILAGKGNNGGDGVVLARYLKMNGFTVHLVFPFGLPQTKTSQEHFSYYMSLGFSYETEIDRSLDYSVIIDSLLGAGARLPLKSEYRMLLQWCNKQRAVRIAIDMPTGVLANTGKVDEVAFQADYTFSLHGFKRSAFLLPSAKYYGKTDALDIGLPANSQWKIWTEDDVRATLSRRDPFSHKGTFGTGLLFAGTDEMPGCALLAGLGAMRMGIGKLKIATTPRVQNAISHGLPEATFWLNGLEQCAKGDRPNGIHAIAIGPGLTDEKNVEQALEHLWTTDIPLILDAGALLKQSFPHRKAPVIITPHPGEFSRLTGISVPEIQQNRFALASQFALENQVIVVLKGTYTAIAYPDGSGVINPTGNPALAKGGSGDTLTGMILALAATESNIKHAVANAVFIHGLCADEFVNKNDVRTMVASDITDYLGDVLQRILKNE